MRKKFISMSSSFSSRRMTGNGSGASQGWGPRNGVMMTTFAAALIWRAIACRSVVYSWLRYGRTLAGVRQRSATFTPQKLPKAAQINSPWELNHWNCWRSLGDSNPCFRRERATSWAARRREQSGEGIANSPDHGHAQAGRCCPLASPHDPSRPADCSRRAGHHKRSALTAAMSGRWMRCCRPDSRWLEARPRRGPTDLDAPRIYRPWSSKGLTSSCARREEATGRSSRSAAG